MPIISHDCCVHRRIDKAKVKTHFCAKREPLFDGSSSVWSGMCGADMLVVVLWLNIFHAAMWTVMHVERSVLQK